MGAPPRRSGERIAAWPPSLPVGVRRYARTEVYRQLHAACHRPYTAHAIVAAIAEVGVAIRHPAQKLQDAAE